MVSNIAAASIQTLDIHKQIEIAAPIEIAFEAILLEIGAENQMPDGSPFTMTIEPWPGGRWFRDLGDNAGHLWGHVQVIKPPTLLEICGPLFMSYPVAGFVQYRLTEDGANTRLNLVHQAMGFILPEHSEGVNMGWEFAMKRVNEIATRLKQERNR